MNKTMTIGFLILVVIFGVIIMKPTLSNERLLTEMVFFGAGDADSMLIKNKSQTILIDAGLKSEREILGDKLRALGVKTIDYVILTHPDKDHIGGASYILDNFQVKNLIQSNLDKGTSRELRIKKSLETRPANNIKVDEDYSFTLGDLEVTIFVPREDSYKKDNDYSLVTLIKDRQLNYLFAGDAEKIGLAELMDRDLPVIDLYKVPHHGKYNSHSIEAIERLSPKFSVITNKQGDKEVVEALELVGSQIFYAFDQDLVFSTDGEKIKHK